jgi:hypothetical protein
MADRANVVDVLTNLHTSVAIEELVDDARKLDGFTD